MTKKNELKTTSITKTNTTQKITFTLDNIIDALKEKYNLGDCWPGVTYDTDITWSCSEDVLKFSQVDLHDDVLILTIDKNTTTES